MHVGWGSTWCHRGTDHVYTRCACAVKTHSWTVKEKLCLPPSASPSTCSHSSHIKIMDSFTVVENIYLLVIITLISVLQNGERKQEASSVTSNSRSYCCFLSFRSEVVVTLMISVCVLSILCPEGGTGMQLSKHQNLCFWTGFLCQVSTLFSHTQFLWLIIYAGETRDEFVIFI